MTRLTDNFAADVLPHWIEELLQHAQAGEAPSAPGARPQGPHDGPGETQAAPLGRLSEQYETGGRGPGTVSSGRGDPGGVSYGSYQLASQRTRTASGQVRPSTVELFLAQEGARWAPEFAGREPGTAGGDFGRQWQAIAERSPREFAQAQHDFIARTHYQPAVDSVRQATGVDLATRSPAVRDAAWSTAVQHRAAPDLLARAVQSVRLPPTDPQYDRSLVNAIYDQRNRYVEGLDSLPARTRTSLLQRYEHERADALRMLAGGSAPAGHTPPPAATPATTPAAPAQHGHAVRQGETLSGIARAHGLTLQDLLRANPQITNPDRIATGQVLNLPAAHPAGAHRTSPDGTPLYRQGDPAWGQNVLGHRRTISQAGCAMTSVAMAISKISGRAIDPGQLDHYLDQHHGYTGDALNWRTAAQAAGLQVAKPHWSLQTVNQQLDAGRPVVVGVDYKPGSSGGANGTDHWIAVTARGTENGKPVYYANDPATGQRITLHEQGGQLKQLDGKGYRSSGELVVFSGGPDRAGAR